MFWAHLACKLLSILRCGGKTLHINIHYINTFYIEFDLYIKPYVFMVFYRRKTLNERLHILLFCGHGFVLSFSPTDELWDPVRCGTKFVLIV